MRNWRIGRKSSASQPQHISCGNAPELRVGLKCLEQVGDAPWAAGEPQHHAAQYVLRPLLRALAFGRRGMVDDIPLSGGHGEVERERHDQDEPGQPVWVPDLAVFEAEAARFEVGEHRLDAPAPGIVKCGEIARGAWFRSGLHAKRGIPWLARLWPDGVDGPLAASMCQDAGRENRQKGSRPQ